MANGTTDPAAALHDAVVAVGRSVQAQSYFLAYSDTFFLMGCALLLAVFAVALMQRGAVAGGAGAH
jgi:DHA2 family multidrug resistance protein